MRSKSIQLWVSLPVLAAVLLGTTWAAHAASRQSLPEATTSYTFAPVADAYVIQSYPAANYGSATVLRADNVPVTRSYLRFNVSGLKGAAIQSARLRFHAESSNTTGMSVRALSNNAWTEAGITYNNSPAAGSVISSVQSVVSGAWISLNVSSYVKSQGTFNFVVTTSSSTNIKLSSRHVTDGSAPRLVVTVTTPSTATPTPPGGSTDWQPSFPIRAAFYYPWFPEAWTQKGIYPYTNYTPKLGFYSNRDAAILHQHIAMMQYGGIQAGIASWWGQGSQEDGKIAALLNAASGTHFRWALYYEPESLGDPSAGQIQGDLTYIKSRYGKAPGFLRINGKFVVFVYSDGKDGCGMADRWKQGNTVGAYVVLKVFNGYLNCASQPDSWHQYSPAVAADQQGKFSYSISPGFWLKGDTVRLARNATRWTQNVKDMVASGANWQLVTTFSEWGEGTAVEPAAQWSSVSGYGQYLDALHTNGKMPAP
ncbi:MAG TPA: DNRLRE domain-containing protein [Anaerolineales bacterium]|nr:DNRLRE domain-containing protein [Anaerolineales bacterium]